MYKIHMVLELTVIFFLKYYSPGAKFFITLTYLLLFFVLFFLFCFFSLLFFRSRSLDSNNITNLSRNVFSPLSSLRFLQVWLIVCIFLFIFMSYRNLKQLFIHSSPVGLATVVLSHFYNIISVFFSLSLIRDLLRYSLYLVYARDFSSLFYWITLLADIMVCTSRTRQSEFSLASVVRAFFFTK